MAEKKREPGFYWVKLKPYTGPPPDEELVTPGWEVLQWWKNRWLRTGVIRYFYEDDIEEVGPRCELEDSKIRSAARSLVIDIEAMQDPDNPDDTHTYGPFTEWSMGDDGGVMIDWYNVGHGVEEYQKIVRGDDG